MYTYLIDFFNDNLHQERSTIYSRALELLDYIDHTEHEEGIIDMLMTSDDYPTTDTINGIDTSIEVAMHNTMSEMGITLNSDTYIPMANLSSILNATISILEGDADNYYESIDNTETSEKERFIEAVASLISIPIYALEDYIDTVSPDFATTISEQEDNSEEIEYDNGMHNAYIIERSKRWKSENNDLNAVVFIRQRKTLGYNYLEALTLLEPELNKESTTDIALNMMILADGSSTVKNILVTILDNISVLDLTLEQQIEVEKIVRTNYVEFS